LIGRSDEVKEMWERNVATPVRLSGRVVPVPLVDYILKVEQEHPDRQIAVLVPELVVRHWSQNLLHNQRAQLLKLLLLVRGNQRIMVINIQWYL
jgi:hypothetical protein